MKIKFKNFSLSDITQIPNSIGVYIFADDKNNYLYVGKSINLKTRITAHIKAGLIDAKEAKIISNSKNIKIYETNDEFTALILESKLIKKFKPKYNSIWKDNKSYVYIKITNEIYPKIYPVRETEINSKDYVIGPLPSVKITDHILKTIRKIIPFCSQKKVSKKRCFYAKLDLCKPCPNEIEKIADPKKKQQLQNVYKRNINQIKKILSGKINEIENYFENKMRTFSKNLDYEQALEYRRKLQLIHRLKHIKLIESYTLKTNQSFKQLENFFRQELNLENLNRIECYDISNLGEKYTTAAMTVMEQGSINKKEYRKFKSKLTKQNDFDNIKNIIKRRFKNNWTKPDLIIVDGGALQIKKAQEAVTESNLSIPVIGIAKKPDRIIIIKDKKKVFRITSRKPFLFALSLLRDEAHRFAQNYHKYLRTKDFLKLSQT
ncbi:MAG: UvrABC system protein C [Patescibacteria group bacterium]|nr:MAG: UvrABC system protein C [Patescibacteria group bacterium]